MNRMAFDVICIDCGFTAPFSPTSVDCPRCASQWRQARYDYDEIAKTLPSLLPSRSYDLWRYRDLLPIRNPNPALFLGEGWTPLIRATNLGMMLGCSNLFIKDERQGPTSSFKDRQAAVTISALKEAGITEMVAASTGNVAISYSAYAARAGIKLWAFVTSLVPAVKMQEIALYGSQVIKVTGSYDQAKEVASEFARQRGLFQDLGARTLTSIEAMKTIAFEICEQLTVTNNFDSQQSLIKLNNEWKSPDWYVQAISGGMGPLGICKGFHELVTMDFTNRIPRIALIQADGCAPMANAWKEGLENALPIKSPRTLIETLATGDPGRMYPLLRKWVTDTNGTFESVSDEEAYRAMHILAKMEGISAEPAAAAAFAGLFKLVRSGLIKPTDVVVVNCTGHTLPAEPSILGENWARDVVVPEKRAEDTPQDGLLAALSHVASDRFPNVAIVDDNPDVRRMIRRILQSQGNYTLIEAENGKIALELIQKRIPDLIILDLMMPEIDGFSVLDALRSKPETAAIPVIVATAKELTNEEKNRLKGQIQSLMQKGDFLSDEFLEEVRALVQ